MRFDGKVAIVTGAGSGIGRATALAFAKEGACVVATDVVEETAKRTADDINSAGGKAIAMKADVTSSKDANAVVQKTLEQYGQIDILFNNAGWGSIGWFNEISEEILDKTIDINLKGNMIFARAVIDDMIKRNYGKIVNMGSDAGRIGMGSQAAYCAAKGGVIAFTKGLARDVARYKINVNCVCPGLIETPATAAMFKATPKLSEGLARGIPLKRMGRPEEVAASVLFLASDEAGYITGQSLSIDGGQVMV